MAETVQLVVCPECDRLVPVTRYSLVKDSVAVVVRYFDVHLWDRTAGSMALCRKSSERVVERGERVEVAA
jgi:hypothetical protein